MLTFLDQGKTDVAVLAVLRAIAQNSTLIPAADGNRARLSSYDFKIVYVAPMKALAAEITRKMSKRLNWLGVSVRELTGKLFFVSEADRKIMRSR